MYAGDFSGRFAWRMFLLAMLGIVNTAFFDGDILFSYAIYGLVLIPLSYLPTKWLWWVVAFLFIQPVEIYSLISGWQVDASALREVYGNMYNGHQHGSFLENAYGNLQFILSFVVSGFVLLWYGKEWFRKGLSFLRQFGKMSLTNYYLAQVSFPWSF